MRPANSSNWSHWLASEDNQDGRRFDNPEDFARLEVLRFILAFFIIDDNPTWGYIPGMYADLSFVVAVAHMSVPYFLSIFNISPIRFQEIWSSDCSSLAGSL
jgi:hypothetical protein